MTAIMLKELRMYFYQMTGYIVLSLTILLTALFFVAINLIMLNPHFQQALGSATILFFVVIPALTMRLFADEVKNKTDQLLYTSPLSTWQIVLGKYLAAGVFFVGAMAVTMIFPIIISQFGELPIAQIIGSYIGFILIGLAFIALGLFISVMTENQIIAAVATSGAIFLIFVLEGIAGGMPADANSSLMFVAAIIVAVAAVLYHSTKNFYAAAALAAVGFGAAVGLFFNNRILFDALIPRKLRWLSVFERFSTLTMGILNLSDIVYYITFASVFVYLTVNVIEKRRWR